MHTPLWFTPYEVVLAGLARLLASQAGRMAVNRPARMLRVRHIPNFKPDSFSLRLSAVRAAQAVLRPVRSKRGGALKPH